jgi:hypothetical protein
MNITIIGSGNIAHALIACLNINTSDKLYILTSTQKNWSAIVAQKDKVGYITEITDDPSRVIPQSNIIMFTLPSFAREEILFKIAPYIQANTLIGAFPGTGGFDEEVKQVLYHKKINIFSAQRVPYIARIIERGKSVKVTPKENIYIAVDKDKLQVKVLLSKLLNMKVILLDNFLEVNLSNSNPILHSARTYSLLKNQQVYHSPVLFYETWNNEASILLLKMDEEFMNLINKLQLKNIKSLKEHYQVNSIEEMTAKIQSIPAFKGISMPMIKTDKGFIADTQSRYFSEDIGIGLKYIREYSKRLKIKTPTIDEVYNRLMQYMKV